MHFEKNALGFHPSFQTCYKPNLRRDKKCKECEFREHVLCESSPNYEEAKIEFEKKIKRKKD